MSNEDLKRKFAEYDEAKKRFSESHEPCECDYCGEKIKPGNDITVHEGRVYCSIACIYSDLDIVDLAFQMDGVDDDGYRDYFKEKSCHQ